MSAECVIVDANIAFKCLITGRGDLRERFGPGGYPQLFTPRFLFVELFKHKDRLVQSSGLAEADLLAGLHTLLNQRLLFTKQTFQWGLGWKHIACAKRLIQTILRTSHLLCTWRAASGRKMPS